MECEFCKKVFTGKNNLRIHQTKATYCLKIQEKTPEISYTCSYCSKIFNRKDSFDVHLTGHLSDKYGRKMMTVIGLSGSSMTIIALTLTSNYLYLVFLALFLGFEAALFYTPLVAMVSDIAPPEVEGTVIGSYRFFRDMGYFIGPIILGKIADMYKLDYSIYLTSVILLVAVIVLIFKLKETNQQNT